VGRLRVGEAKLMGQHLLLVLSLRIGEPEKPAV